MDGKNHLPSGFGVDLALLMAPDTAAPHPAELLPPPGRRAAASSIRRPSAALLAALDRGFDAEGAIPQDSEETGVPSAVVTSLVLGGALSIAALMIGVF